MRLCCGLLLASLVACGSSTGYGGNPPPPPPPPAPPPAPGTVFVTISEYQFSPDTITIAKSTPVRWTNSGTVSHTATADNGSFDSGTLDGTGTDPYGNPMQGGKYDHTFTTAGTFTYEWRYQLSFPLSTTWRGGQGVRFTANGRFVVRSRS